MHLRVVCTTLLFSVVTLLSPSTGVIDTPADSASPRARWGHAMAYDSTRDSVVLFGGAVSRTEMLGDTWVWDGTSWRSVDVPGPSPRAYAAMTFDSRRGKVILHGGRDEERNSLSDTWEWDGWRWRQAATEGPPGRDHHAIVFDEARGVTILFGGYGNARVYGDTWQWDGETWTLLHPGGPPPRAAFDMAFDAEKHTIILYGGLWLGGLYADLWQWDGRTWTILADPYANPTRDHHTAAYDVERRQYLIFGGKNYRFTALGSLFELQGGRLVEMAREGPSPRYNSAMVYDSKGNHMVVFGGRVRNGDTFIAMSDTWIWNGSAWTEVTPGE